MGLDGAALALWRDVAVPLRDGTITRVHTAARPGDILGT